MSGQTPRTFSEKNFIIKILANLKLVGDRWDEAANDLRTAATLPSRWSPTDCWEWPSERLVISRKDVFVVFVKYRYRVNQSLLWMRHAFYSYRMSWKQFERVFGLWFVVASRLTSQRLILRRQVCCLTSRRDRRYDGRGRDSNHRHWFKAHTTTGRSTDYTTTCPTLWN